MTRQRTAGRCHLQPCCHLVALLFAGLAASISVDGPCQADEQAEPSAKLFALPTYWQYSAPLIEPEQRETNPSHAQKDPTVVFHGGRWHVFMSVKLPKQYAWLIRCWNREF